MKTRRQVTHVNDLTKTIPIKEEEKPYRPDAGTKPIPSWLKSKDAASK